MDVGTDSLCTLTKYRLVTLKKLMTRNEWWEDTWHLSGASMLGKGLFLQGAFHFDEASSLHTERRHYVRDNTICAVLLDCEALRSNTPAHASDTGRTLSIGDRDH